MEISTFNTLNTSEVYTLLMECCYCEYWAKQVIAQRPYQDYDALLQNCLFCWHNMSEREWLEAFGHHAKIGDVNALRDKFGKARKEQGQIQAASDDVIEALYKANQTYEQQNCFIFIVCATGKSADEMLSILNERLKNPRETELLNAAQEQAKILEIRLANQFLTSAVCAAKG